LLSAAGTCIAAIESAAGAVTVLFALTASSGPKSYRLTGAERVAQPLISTLSTASSPICAR